MIYVKVKFTLLALIYMLLCCSLFPESSLRSVWSIFRTIIRKRPRLLLFYTSACIKHIIYLQTHICFNCVKESKGNKFSMAFSLWVILYYMRLYLSLFLNFTKSLSLLNIIFWLLKWKYACILCRTETAALVILSLLKRLIVYILCCECLNFMELCCFMIW